MEGDKPSSGGASGVSPTGGSADVPTAVHAEDLVVDHDRQREEVEHVREVRPHMRRAVLAHAFRVEPVCLQKEVEFCGVSGAGV